MAFTHALYYPWIDIANVQDEIWLKTAILYWDKISTIVPDSYRLQPYNSDDAIYLSSLDILVPEFVDSSHQAVEEASKLFFDYLDSPDVKAIAHSRIPSIEQTRTVARINHDKITRELQEYLLESRRAREDGDWLTLAQEFANYYMVLLASTLSSYKHYSPLTDTEPFESFSNVIRRGDASNSARLQRMGEGLLAKMTLDSVGIAPETPFENIVELRKDYVDEIGNFRSQIGKLAKQIDPESPSVEALKQQVNDIYINEIAPAVNQLKKALQRSKVRVVVTHLSSFVFAELIKHSLPVDQSVNLLISAGSQIVARGINYSLDKKDELSKHPYSFVLSAKQQLS